MSSGTGKARAGPLLAAALRNTTVRQAGHTSRVPAADRKANHPLQSGQTVEEWTVDNG
jgi:hypothetical protein